MAPPILSTARADQVSWLLAAVALIAVLKLHLLSALFAGLLVYELVHGLAPLLQRRLFSERSRLAAVVVLATLIVGILVVAIIGAIAYFRSDAGSLVMGMIIGAMVSLREAAPSPSGGPLGRALEARAFRLGDAFRRVVFAQVRIAAINTVLTALYLVVLLPAFGIKLPLTGTLVAVTFVTGLLPVVGNVISNSIIVVVSLAHSPQLALASLAFLVSVHKLEYFLNARIIGTRIHARAWELLLAILVMEAAFGLAGAIAAPVYYAYLKHELVELGLI